MEAPFKSQIKNLRLGAGESFHGEGEFAPAFRAQRPDGRAGPGRRDDRSGEGLANKRSRQLAHLLLPHCIQDRGQQGYDSSEGRGP